MPFLVVAAVRGMVRVVEALLGHGADLLARDARGHLAVCRAVHNSHVDVVNAASVHGQGGKRDSHFDAGSALHLEERATVFTRAVAAAKYVTMLLKEKAIPSSPSAASSRALPRPRPT